MSIFTKLEGNSYITIKNKSLTPTSRGKILSKIPRWFFFKFVDYEFTANLEEQLDNYRIQIKLKETLKHFLLLTQQLNKVEEKSITEVINKINDLSPEIIKQKNCPKCQTGESNDKICISRTIFGLYKIQ